jgi:MFS family permease
MQLLIPFSIRFVTLGMSALCLAVALGSAMPTGNLPAQAEDLHVSNEAIFISITVFVVGFGVGPLLFAPRKSQVLLVVMVLIEYPPS